MNPHIKSFSSHLGDLRNLIIGIFGCLVGGVVLALPLAPYAYDWLRIPFERSGVDVVLRVTQVGGGFSVFLRVTMLSGLLFSFPLIVVLASRYLLPALHAHERHIATRAGIASFFLFLVGGWMAYHWTIPVALRFMVRVENWMETPAMFWETTGYIRFVIRILLAFGLAFQLPVLVVLLGAGGIVSAAQLRTYRRHVIVGLFVLAMLLTPPDPFTMVLMAMPLVILFEVTIWLVVGMEKRRYHNPFQG